ncbi:MAG: ABC transporter substrate-binding protein [Trueperaceae bacterium]
MLKMERFSVGPLTVALFLALCGLMALGAATAQGDEDSIVIAQTVDATSLDPAFRDNTRTGNLILHIFDPLVMRMPDMSLEPWLAESLEQVSDTEWLVHLRGGIMFSNGEPLNAQAVAFSLERILDPELQAPTTRWFNTFTSIEVVDELTLRITTDSVDPLFPVRLTFLYPVPPEYVQEIGNSQFALNPIGTGPYELVEWVRDDHIALEAKSDYWREPAAIESVTFRVVPEEVSRVSALVTGEADLIESISPEQGDYLSGIDEVRVETAPSTRALVLNFGTDVPPADQQKFRAAVGHAINTEVIVSGLYKGYAEPVNSYMSPATPGWPNENDYTFEYDPERARELLSEIDLGDQEIVLRSTTAYPIFRNLALVLASQLSEVGLNVEVTSEEWGAWFADLQAKDMSAIYLNDHGNVWIDPYPQLDAFFHSEGFLSTYSNPEVDELLASSNMARGEERSQILGEAMQVLIDDAAGVPLLSQVSIYGVNESLQWQPRPDGVINAYEMATD